MNEDEYLDDMIETLCRQISIDVETTPDGDTDKRLEYLERLAKLRREEHESKREQSRPRNEIILKALGIVGSLACIGAIVWAEHTDIIMSKNALGFIPKRI